MNPTHIAQCASLAMLLEVSATPKPGNIDREHNYEDTRYEHFLASAIATQPVIEKAVQQKKNLGKLLKKAVIEANQWQHGGNTHFGALLLLLPLTMAEGNTTQAWNIVKNTTTEDAIHFYQAFRQARVKAAPVNQLSLQDNNATAQIQKEGKTLYQLMQMAENRDQIAREWTKGFPLTQKAHQLLTHHTHHTDINRATVKTYLEILGEQPDTFIQTKHDRQTSHSTTQQAATLLHKIHQKGYNQTLPEIKKFDEELLAQKINPGSTADIIIAGLFLLLLKGYRP